MPQMIDHVHVVMSTAETIKKKYVLCGFLETRKMKPESKPSALFSSNITVNKIVNYKQV